jgi:tetratricopeptide (TPR) repeat protein
VFAHLTHALAWEVKACYREALDALLPVRETARDLPNYAGYLGYAHAKLGNRAEAETVLQQLLSRYPGPWVPGYDVAVICCALGDEQSALHWLERAYELRAPDMLFLRDDPRFGTLRSHPVCKSIIRGIGFEPD